MESQSQASSAIDCTARRLPPDSYTAPRQLRPALSAPSAAGSPLQIVTYECPGSFPVRASYAPVSLHSAIVQPLIETIAKKSHADG